MSILCLFIQLSFYNNNDENVHRFAVRGELLERERKERERQSPFIKIWYKKRNPKEKYGFIEICCANLITLESD